MRRLGVLLLSLLTFVGTVGAATVSGASGAAAVPMPTLTGIRAAHHPGFDRIVFEFSGPLPETTRVRWVDQVVQDGSGLPVRISGNAFLEVTMFAALAHTGSGATTYGPSRRAYALPNIAHVVNSGDFEAVVSFGIGVMKKTSILRTMRLTSPSRYVVDVRTNFARVAVKDYFLDLERFINGTPPYVRGVWRTSPVPGVARGAMVRLYAGPTQAEIADDLRFVRSHSRSFSHLSISSSKVARVRLTGGCNSDGSTFTVANEIMPTLRRFASVDWVKIYDPSGHTETPTGLSDSIPFCLEP